MVEMFRSGGVMMWPMLVVAIGILVLAARAATLLARADPPAAEAERRLSAILFWAGMSVVLGVLGTVVGFVQIGQAVMLAESVEQSTIWGGVAVALVTLIFGLLILLVALLLWFGLKQWLLRAAERHRPFPA